MTTELTELWEKNPGDMNDADIAVIVKKMRENRAQFELGLKTPVGERRKAPAKSKKITDDTLKELGLEPDQVDILKDLGL